MIAFESGAEVLGAWSEMGPIDLLVADLSMPGGVSGAALADQLRARSAGLRIIIASGFSPETLSAAALQGQPGFAFVPKPFAVSDLVRQVRSLLDEPLSAREFTLTAPAPPKDP